MIDVKNYSVSEVLKDGTPVIVRAIRSDDRDGILGAFINLDREAIYTRFFTYRKNLADDELEQITEVDFNRVVALVVTTPTEGGEKLIGGGRYCSEDPTDNVHRAELAFVTEQHYRGRGIAGLILRSLAGIAREQGVSRFEADVLAQNQGMLEVFSRSGLPMKRRREGNVVHVTLSLEILIPGPLNEISTNCAHAQG